MRGEVILHATFLVAVVIFSQTCAGLDIVVSTTSGKVRGMDGSVDGVLQFLGIPYAKQERFQHCKPYPKWPGIRNATSYGAACTEAEDCLFLDIYAPANASSGSPRAVMVFIHGGGFEVGAGKSFSGSTLAKLHDVLIVCINYRLGVLGFFNIPGTDIKGNYGVLDQIQALKWVRDNIANFGGDPQSVTVFGSSAGSASVSLLAMSPLSKGLFQKAIMQSGSADATWVYDYPSEATSRMYAKAVQCPESPSADFVSCLKQKSLAEIRAAQRDFSYTSIMVPVVDQHFLVKSPRELLESGEFEDIPVMMGTNINEGCGFSFRAFAGTGKTNKDLKLYIESVLLAAPGMAEGESVKRAAVFEYSDYECLEVDCSTRIRQLGSDVTGDFYFVAPVDFEARARSQAGATVYTYLFSYEPTQEWCSTTHSSELSYVFGEALNPIHNMSTAAQNVSKKVMMSWTSFAKSSNPNHDELGVTWPKFVNNGTGARAYLEINEKPSVQKLYRPHHCAFWNDYVQELRNTKCPPVVKCPEVSEAGRVVTTETTIHLALLACTLILQA